MKALAHRIDHLVAQMQRTAADIEAEAVHDLRVSVRRATEALRIYREQVPKARKLGKEIKAVRDLAAAVRDRDVTFQLLRRHRLPVSDPACIYLQGQRDLAAQQLQEFLKRHLSRTDRWRRWIGEHS